LFVFNSAVGWAKPERSDGVPTINRHAPSLVGTPASPA
jgi:hypothetical protein